MALREARGSLCCQHAVEAHYEWKVNFTSLKPDYFFSPDILFSGSTFKLLLQHSDYDGYTWLFLQLISQSPPIKIRFTLGIKAADGYTEALNTGTREFSRIENVTSWKWMLSSELLHRRKELAPCSVLTITANLEIDVSRPDIGTKEVAVQTSVEDAGDQEANGGRQTMENTDIVTLVQSLKDLYVAGKNCDVTLEVKDKKFRAHKLILGARTPVLSAMFSHNTTEAETGIVRVEDCHPEAFEVFLKFVYTDIADDLTEDNVKNVYYAADKYDLPGLKKECVRHMLSNLTTGSVCSVIDLAARHGEELLQEKATEFFVENAREIFRTPFWRKFMVENSSLAYELINRVHEN